jgi:hypothetical protein
LSWLVSRRAGVRMRHRRGRLRRAGR